VKVWIREGKLRRLWAGVVLGEKGGKIIDKKVKLNDKK
jgi:hypothetical protein